MSVLTASQARKLMSAENPDYPVQKILARVRSAAKNGKSFVSIRDEECLFLTDSVMKIAVVKRLKELGYGVEVMSGVTFGHEETLYVSW
jgi:hypothetical protein